jgi:CheY-like chemotaxis protein
VKVNPSLLIEVIEGMFHNALDAMPDGGTLSIRGNTAARGAMIQLHISDTGHGIPFEHVPHLFNTPFFTTKTDKGGLGFGLWLSRLYLRSVGGDIQLTETSPKGSSTFTLSLPMVPGSLPVAHAVLTEEPAQTPHRKQAVVHRAGVPQVLIVEDESNWQSRLALPFLDQGWEVKVAANYAEAINLLEQHDFATFVVDVRLAENDPRNMDGLNVVQPLRTRGVFGPVVLLSVWETLLTQAGAHFKDWKDIDIVDKMDEHLDEVLLTFSSTRGDDCPSQHS